MATTENLRQVSESLNASVEPIIPRHGVVALFGYGVHKRPTLVIAGLEALRDQMRLSP